MNKGSLTKLNNNLAVDISIVIPVYNEAESLELLYQLLGDVLKQTGQSYELIFVEDGSTDNSFEVLEALHSLDRRVQIVQFRRNFGKSAALSAGFAETTGKIVITMDADLQDNPTEIPILLDKLNQGYDLVSGWKFPRLDPISKTWPSWLFNRVTALLTGIKLHDFNCGFKAYRQEAVKEIILYGELHRYIPVLAYMRGFKIGEVKVKHHSRRFGQSKYGFTRFARGAFDLITILFLSHYQWRPLHIFGWPGVIFFLIGLLINFYLTVLWFLEKGPIGDRPLLLLGVLMAIIGIQFVSFGLLAEMFSRSASHDREYSIRQKLQKNE